MKFRSIAAILTAVALILSCMAGCKNTEKASSKEDSTAKHTLTPGESAPGSGQNPQGGGGDQIPGNRRLGQVTAIDGTSVTLVLDDGQMGGGMPGGSGQQPPEGGSGQQPPQGGSGQQPPEGGNGQQPPEGGSGQQPPAGGSGQQPPEGGSGQQPPEGGSGHQPPEGGNGQQPPEGGNGQQPPIRAVRSRTVRACRAFQASRPAARPSP